MARLPQFVEGLERVEAIAASPRVALLCSEHEPLACHRFVLIGRRLAERGADVRHILRDGGIELHHDTEERLLLRLAGQVEADLLASRAERLELAYRAQNHQPRNADICTGCSNVRAYVEAGVAAGGLRRSEIGAIVLCAVG